MNPIVALLISAAIAISLLVGCRDGTPPADSAQTNEGEEVGASSLPGVIDSPADRAPSGERKIKYWVAPMDPTFISDKPGKSPMGMALVPVYEDGGESEVSNTILIDPVVVQNMGVRTARVTRRTLFRHVRTIGEVEVGEDQLSVINLRFSGWVEKIYADKTGDPIKKDDTLFEIYSPSLVAAQGEFLLALRTQGKQSDLARSARRKLELLDFGKADIDAIERDRRVRRALPIRAPRSGFILEKNVVEGARIEEGRDLYRIGDLSTIWVTAEIYEYDAPWVEVGQPAQMELAYEPGKVIEGRVAYIYPTLDKSSRTLSVRLEFENPGNRLKPGMFATVYVQFQRRDDVLVVPTEAIIHSGIRQLVFTTPDDGHFEPREITTGLVGDRQGTEVLSGLDEGDLVVVSGQFLIDSESQLNEAIRKMLERGSENTALSDEADGAAVATVWSCPMHPEIASKEFGRCPICGMDLERRAGSPEELHEVHGRHEDHGPRSMDYGAQEHRDDAIETRYVCPMHLDVVADEPGRCPICGMFLEERSKEGGGK